MVSITVTQEFYIVEIGSYIAIIFRYNRTVGRLFLIENKKPSTICMSKCM
jgi:hypothetical protein